MIKKILLFIWQLPQNIIGFFLTRKPVQTLNQFLLNDGKIIKVYFTKNVFNCGISLGNYIVLDYDIYYKGCLYRDREYVYTVNHEHGHQKQSLYFGWLYLIFIGLPSVCGNVWDRVFHKKWKNRDRVKWYYSKLIWEKWADKLGEVNREL